VQATYSSTQGQAMGKRNKEDAYNTPTPGGQAHNRIINKAYRKHPTERRTHSGKDHSRKTAQNTKRGTKTNGKGGKVYSLPTPYFIFILIKIY
jgi:hypothetical protein